MLISQPLLDDLIAHAREEYDAECCGLVGYAPADASSSNGQQPRRAVRVLRARNVHASRKRFEIDGKELLHALSELEDAGLELGAIYHSHTH
ncbi:MAG TPA: Mov34/MPN/PAD-1 family protein, partial [Solirubrobacteraceae bacterium]|nr:Mov34/MPN/PAD-1 family protein [Solirubrobacteraceae bacterium]